MNKNKPHFMKRYVWPGWSLSFGVLLVIVLAAAYFAADYTGSGFRSYRIEFVVEADREVQFAIYYDIGRGYNEVDHQSKMIEQVGVPARVEFCIPVWTELEKIRFDPARQHVRMVIHSITIIYDEDTRHEVPLATLVPRNDILHHDYDGQRFIVETAPEGEDPIIDINGIGEPGNAFQRKEPGRYIIWMGSALLLLLAGRFLYRFFILAE